MNTRTVEIALTLLVDEEGFLRAKGAGALLADSRIGGASIEVYRKMSEMLAGLDASVRTDVVSSITAHMPWVKPRPPVLWHRDEVVHTLDQAHTLTPGTVLRTARGEVAQWRPDEHGQFDELLWFVGACVAVDSRHLHEHLPATVLDVPKGSSS